jgi:flagellar hook-associated protein 1 FlgK
MSGMLKAYIDIRDGNNGENFSGNISTGDTTATLEAENKIVVENCSRNDITDSGEITIDGITYEYTEFTYDESSNSITFTLDSTTDGYVYPSEAVTNGASVEIGEEVDYKGIPYYIQQLNEFVRTIAQEFNELNESGNDGTGVEIFTYEGYDSSVDSLTTTSDYNEITIANFQLSEDVEENSDLICCSTDSTAGESANDLILDMIDLRYDNSLFDIGDMDSYMQSIVAEVAIESEQATNFATSQESLLDLVENQRLSYSGVDTNEETTNLVKYQQAYELSAQMISVLSEIYEATINLV